VIVRVLLGTHRARLAAIGIEKARLLHDLAAVLDPLPLAAYLECDRLLEEAEGVEVLDLAARAERVTGLAHGDVGVAAEGSLLHVAGADADPQRKATKGPRRTH